MMLVDGAETVDIWPRWSPESIVRDAHGWQTFCCSGPAAPLPAAVRRHTEVGLLATDFVVRVEHGGSTYQLRHRVFFVAYEQMGEDALWPMVMDELAERMNELDE